jgi:probable phosphoglycerate mutase
MITLYAIRHGETDYNREDRVQGSQDSHLTDYGLAQARALAKRFKSVPLTALYASPLSRAWLTAGQIAAACGSLEIEPVNDFRELDCGVFEGRLLSDIKVHDWAAWTAFLANPAIAPEGGESMNMLFDRVSHALDRILAGTPDGATIAIVSHAGVVRMTLAHLMGVGVASAVNFGLSNASVATFMHKYSRWICLKWNDTGHLGDLEGEAKFVL